MSEQKLRIGEKVWCYSSVGKQLVVITEINLSVVNPFDGKRYGNMVTVLYENGGKGVAHEKQLERLEIAE